jgi:hypothetical protein
MRRAIGPDVLAWAGEVLASHSALEHMTDRQREDVAALVELLTNPFACEWRLPPIHPPRSS